MIRINRLIIILSGLLVSIYTPAQPVCNDKTLILNGPPACETVSARDSIKLIPGFYVNSGSSFNALIDESLIVNTTYLSEPPDESRSLDYSKAVGTLPGNVSVNSAGAATYTIPLEIPPGTAGMQPVISLVYNSMAGNGIMGIGWNIGGISVISRVGQDRFNEGDIRPVDFSTNDRLMLNGQRLILSNGSWFATNSEYKTQQETFQRIKYKGTSFEVETPDGLVLHFGESLESRLCNAGGVALTWHITRAVDRFGNTINYIYKKIPDTNEILIDRIEYTKTNLFEAYNKIQFVYENSRSDCMMNYRAGIKVNADNLLKRISVYANGSKIKEFSLNYFTDSNFDSYLSSIHQTGESELKTNSTQINWVGRPQAPGYGDSFTFYEDNQNLSSYTENQIMNRVNGIGSKYAHVVLDADGDGVSDILSIPVGSSPSPNLSLRYNKLNSSYSHAMPTGYSGAFSIDIDGDGRDEIFFHKGNMMEYENGYSVNSRLSYTGVQDLIGTSQLQFQIMKFSNNILVPVTSGNNYGITGLQNLEYKIYQGDYDGNGTTDLLFANHGTSSIAYQLYLSEVVSGSVSFVKRAEGVFNRTGGSLYNADFNGDGKQDIVFANSTEMYISYLNKIAGSSNYNFSQLTLIKSGGKISGMGDLNGDGKVDIFDEQNRKIYFFSGLTSPAFEEQGYTNASGKYVGADCNDDGLNEIMSQTITSTGVVTLTSHFQSGGSSASNVVLFGIRKLHQSLFGDFNGDGIVEKLYYYAYVDASPQYSYEHVILQMEIHSMPAVRQQLLAGAVLNGLNRKTEVVYDYTSSAGSSYKTNETLSITTPVRVINPRLIVVKTVNNDNGRDGFVSVNYKYENARIHIDGKGFLSYGRITETNTTLGIKTEKRFGFYSTVYDPLPLYSVDSTTSAPAKILSGTDYTFTYYSYGTSGQKHYIIYTNTVNNYDYLRMFKQNIVYTFDTIYGNNTKIVQKSYVTSPSLTLKETVTIDNTFEGYLGNRFYRLKTTASSTVRPSMTASKSKKSFEYLNANCTHVSKEILYYYNPATGVEDTDKDTISYSYSSLGNAIQMISQLGNIKRTASYKYDTKERFKREFTDPLGYAVTNEYDCRGLLLFSKDTNNMSVTRTYDGLGRLIAVDNPDDSDEEYMIEWVGSDDRNAPEYAQYYQVITTPVKPYVKTYYDKLGRILRTFTQAQNGKLVFTDVVYNEKGQQVQVSLPYFKGTAASAVNWQYMTYYDDGRLKTSYADNNIKKITYTYDKNKVIQTMNNTGQVYTKIFDPTGLIIEASDPGGTIKYDYYSSGNLKSVISPSCTTKVEYDKYNAQKKLIDPNAGTIEYEHNAYGEIVYQKDARGNWFRYTKVDKAGRPLIKTSSDGSTVNYSYDTDFKGALYSVSHSNGTSSQYLHNALGLVTSQKETIGGILYETRMDYDTYGRVRKITYPSNVDVNYTYTANGYLSDIKHTNNTMALWSAGDVNAFGEWKNFTLGNGINRTFTYNVYGMPDEIKTNTIQSLKYDFNIETGNLTSRKNVLSNLTETFTYNNLDQLTSWKVGTTTYALNYRSDGTSRINSKTDAGTYAYGSSPAIHRVTGINNNPGTINNVNAGIDYNVFNKVDSVYESGKYKQKFVYGADEQRRISRLYNSSNALVKETIYVPGGYEVEKRGANIRQIHYIPVGDCWALYTKNSAGADSVYFILTDHLGSIHQITNASGTVLKEMSFDPWGRRRNPANWTYNNVPAVSITNRGFTMHEHMDHFKLINMNGRVYDPVLTQFLSPDPFVANAASTVSYNRYAYCNYNPLKYVDPSGYLTQAEYNNILDDLLSDDHPYGGSWSPDGGTSYYGGPGEAFGAGVDYNDTHNSWGYTYPGSKGAYAYNYYAGGFNNSLTPLSINGHDLSHASKYFFVKYFSHFKNSNLAKPTNWISWDNFTISFQEGQMGFSIDNLGNAVMVADYGINLAKIYGYKATIGVWRGLSNFRYYPSGWTGSNQFVWKTFSVTSGISVFLWGANTTIEYLKYRQGQSGLETSLNIGASATSLIVAAKAGTPAGIATSVGYEYFKFLLNAIYGYGESINNLYNNAYQDYWKGTLLDPQYEYEY